MIRNRKINYIIVMLVLAVAFFAAAAGMSTRQIKASANTDVPSTENMTKLLTENSTAWRVWGVPDSITGEYSYSVSGAAFKMNYPSGVTSAGLKISHAEVDNGHVIHKFTTDLFNQWEYHNFVFRSDNDLNDFTALAFRKNGGAVKVFSRVGEVFYTGVTDGFTPSTQKAEYNVVTGVSQLTDSSTVDVVIESDYDYVKVWFNGVLGYETTLLHRVSAGTGIFCWSGASSASNFSVRDAQCYTDNKETMNNAINDESIVYSPFGGGGAQSKMNADGATLSAGSSKDGVALFTSPAISGQTIQTYKFVMDTSTANRLLWYTVLIRADANLDNYVVFQIRRAYGQCAVSGHLNGFNLSYAPDEPFVEKNNFVFPVKSLTGMQDFDVGTSVSLTIVSDNNGIIVYNGQDIIYSIEYSKLAMIENATAHGGFKPSNVAGYVKNMPSATGMFSGRLGYRKAEYSGINCYYGGAKLNDTMKNTFLSDIAYKGDTLDGFTPGSFEYDITITSAQQPDKTALTFVKGAESAECNISWQSAESDGFEKAVLTYQSGNVIRKYTITFEIYDTPKPFVREKWEIEGEIKDQVDDPLDDPENGCGSIFDLSAIALTGCIIILLSVVIFTKRRNVDL